MEEKNIDSEVLEMAQTKEEKKIANRDAVSKYQKERDYFCIRPDKEAGKLIREYAAAQGISGQKLFIEAVRAYMNGENYTKSGNYCVDLGDELGERTEMMAKAKQMTLEEYARNAVKEQRKRDIQEFSKVEFGKN